jgi:hypothetical protein
MAKRNADIKKSRKEETAKRRNERKKEERKINEDIYNGINDGR